MASISRDFRVMRSPVVRPMRAVACGLVVASGCGSPSAPDPVPARPIPCLAGTIDCAERVSIAPGVFLPVHSTHLLTTGDPDVTRAIIVVHGTDRNGDDYFERMISAASTAGLLDNTVIVAPTFQTIDDGPAPDEAYWTSGGWKRGHLSVSSGPSPRVSAYAAIDRTIKRLADARRFPGIVDLVVTGHSAGGQVAHRFSATSRVEDRIPDIRVRYVVANPSTYLYLGPERDSPQGFVVPDADACPDYNEWHYGLDDLNSYADAVTPDSIRAQLVRRDVRILLGDADSLSASLDVSCGANLQGRHRLDRGRTLVRAMASLFPGNAHRETIVPGVGHSSSRMYRSAAGRNALFGH